MRCGVRHAVVAPGSRSTPLALALLANGALDVHVHHDERAASFMALGIGKASGQPAILLCTSGTAAAELHPAVVEAHLARVPMLVCTADRPPELQSVGAPQTIDQTHLYGRAVRWFVEPGVADEATSGTWRSLAARAHLESTGRAPGPVHLNLAFRDPLVGEPGALPRGRPDGRAWHVAPARVAATAIDALEAPRGIVVAGAGAPSLEGCPWPVLADPTSGLRVPGAIGAFDAILRAGVMPEPDLVLRVGDAPASKVLAQWLASLPCPQIAVGDALVDPDRTAWEVRDDVPVIARGDEGWLASWRSAEDAAQHAIDDVLRGQSSLTEPFVARTVAAHASTLVVSSSMPVRDLEWFAAPRDGLRVLANRGANGIDGTTSTAFGVAAGSAGPVVLLTGDVTLAHDLGGLLAAPRLRLPLTIVLVDNGGGGIFDFLPVSTQADAYEEHVATPTGLSAERIADLFGLVYAPVSDLAQFRRAVEHGLAGDEVVLVHVRTDRAENVALHRRCWDAVGAALQDA